MPEYRSYAPIFLTLVKLNYVGILIIEPIATLSIIFVGFLAGSADRTILRHDTSNGQVSFYPCGQYKTRKPYFRAGDNLEHTAIQAQTGLECALVRQKKHRQKPKLHAVFYLAFVKASLPRLVPQACLRCFRQLEVALTFF